MTQMRKCEICGQQKNEAEFSKSYKHRCKECVAEAARAERAAKSKNTNETLKNVLKILPEVPGTILDTQPDWEQRRYEVAKEIFFNMIGNYQPPHLAAKQAAAAANAFIKALQEVQPEEDEEQ